ncbi:MAG: DEAD/DEAH box helicase [Mycobacteriaceae bacterium]
MLTSGRFTREYSAAATARVAFDLLGTVSDAPTVDWSYLLSCASVMAMSYREDALDAALRIAQTALLATDAQEVHRDAAVLLLDRAGNHPALALARRRDRVGEEALSHYPAPLRMEIVRSRLELKVPALGGGSASVSRFQRDLWTAVESSDWISASAPTSAGKSFIVRRWFAERAERAMRAGSPSNLVAVVPTRALVEEVSRELAYELPDGVTVRTLPFTEEQQNEQVQVFVLTQERLHLLQQRRPSLSMDLVFVDEAHKLNDGSRGVLLHQVLDEAVRRNPGSQIVFASPLAEDPEVLLEGAPERARATTIDSQAVTVTQNLLYANQVRGRTRSWVLDLLLPDGARRLGEFELKDRPHPDSKRLPFIAVALGSGGGNLVYADGAAAAETTAQLIFEALGPTADLSADPDVAALIELVERTVNPRYALARTLRRGIAFHYGNIPQLVRSSIEELFRSGKVQYLVCTSTLLEGVNLPCRSIFVRGPHRGRGKAMSPADFWNLAGRAGRWGKEFEGNIICVDTTDESRWPEPPRRRVRQHLRRQTADVLAAPNDLIAYIQEGTPPEASRGEMEAVYSFLASRIVNGVQLDDIPGLSLTPDAASAVSEAVRASLTQVRLPPTLLSRHAGISPLLMQALLERMAVEPVDSLLLAPPEDRGAWAAYANAFRLLRETTGADFGVPARQNQLAVLVVQWMKGLPLARLVQDRLDYQARLPKSKAVPATIRSVMDDVENIARFLAPKYLACYRDVLGQHLANIGREDLAASVPEDIEMLLELGVSTRSELSLLELGLSRTSAVELFALMAEDALTPSGAVDWLSAQDLSQLDVPELVRREIERLLRSRPR